MSIKKANSSLDRNKNRLLLLNIFYRVDNKRPFPVLCYIFFSLYLLNINPFREIKASFYISYFMNLLLTAIVYD